MATRISFNQWLTLQTSGAHAAVAAVWVTSRGRLTAESVEARTAAAGLPAGAGAAAFQDYLVAVATKAPAPAP